MNVPVQLSFRNMDRSEAVAKRAQEKVDKLHRRFDRMTSCRVVIEVPHRHHHKGQLYQVSLEIGVPNHQLVVNRHPKDHHAHEDVYVALRDAFDAAGRLLDEHIRKVAGKA